jgi:hypothetical protein
LLTIAGRSIDNAQSFILHISLKGDESPLHVCRN